MIEAFFCKYGVEYDAMRIDYGIREFANHWYVGDGLYGDGAQYHWDYYNSYVIQPFLGNILMRCADAMRGPMTSISPNSSRSVNVMRYCRSR